MSTRKGINQHVHGEKGDSQRHVSQKNVLYQ